MWYFDPESFREHTNTQINVNFATASSVTILPSPDNPPDYYEIVVRYPGGNKNGLIAPNATYPHASYEKTVDFLIALFSALQDGHIVVTPDIVAEYLEKTVTQTT